MAAILAAFVATQLAIAVTTVYLHRALAHRALTVAPAVALPFRVICWMTTGQRPREWVAVHRKHHAATDTPEDPHSPAQLGFWKVQLGNVGLYKSAAADPTNLRKYARDIPSDNLDRLLFDHALLGLGVGIVIMMMFTWALGLGLLTGLIAALLHAGLYVMLAASVNAVGHTFGKRPHANSATNGQLLAFVTGGEGFHNNHHAAPTSARFSLQRGEIDPGWWLVQALTKLKLARVRHDEVHLKAA
ncbi:MAG: fatty acid desaturase protein [Actinomycetia bacterium]|nr:fatty acid desaturase protein [Actinomycetes bacterium]